MADRLTGVVAFIAWAGFAALQDGVRAVSAQDASSAGNPERGKMLFEKCAACHSLDGTDADGPTLKGVFGRGAGSLEAYRYSAAMKRSGVVWDVAAMEAYVTDPQAFMKGNRMAFAGMTDKGERDDLMAYLKEATKLPDER